MAVTLKDEKVLDTWGLVMEGGAGHAAGLLQQVQDLLKFSELPGITWQKVDAQPGMIKGWFGKKREYLMVCSEALKDYRMYLGVRDYGKHLDVSWFLTVEPGFFKSAFSAMLAHGNINALSFNLDVFDAQDLRAYVTSVHHCCVIRAVEAVAGKINMDTSKFNWTSKGLLQVW
jgi:hypothetical protein